MKRCVVYFIYCDIVPKAKKNIFLYRSEKCGTVCKIGNVTVRTKTKSSPAISFSFGFSETSGLPKRFGTKCRQVKNELSEKH